MAPSNGSASLTQSGEECKPLHYYVQNAEKFFTTDVTFEFHAGIHILESSEVIHINNVTNFTLKGSHQNMPMLDSVIKCQGTKKTGFHFTNASQICLENLTILGCGMVLAGHTRAALSFDTIHSLAIKSVTVSDSLGFGIHACQVVGNVTISNSDFTRNIGNHYWDGGNAKFQYSNCPNATNISITNSRFMHGYNEKKNCSYPIATGLALLIDCLHVDAHMVNITVTNNTADNGGNLAIRLNFTADSGIGSVVLRDSTICQGKGHRGGGLRVWSIPRQPISNNPPNASTILRVLNTCFIENHADSAGGALYISHYEHDGNVIVHGLEFIECTFSRNSVPAYGNGAVTEIIKHKVINLHASLTPQFEVTFKTCNITNNWIMLDNVDIVHGAIMDIFSVAMINFQDCQFANNNSTAISTVGSTIILKGELTFENNSAGNGGAIRFCDTSVMYINNNTRVLFKENQAKFFGGAIYAQQRCLETATPCFFQPVVADRSNITELNESMQLVFIGNRASISGDALYGGSIDVCYSYTRLIRGTSSSYYLSHAIFDNIFDLSEQNGSVISSDPYGVCLCYPDSSKKNCNIKQYNVTGVYPGKEFSIHAIPIGQREGLAPAVIKGLLIHSNNHTSLHETRKNLLSPAKNCKELRYSIHSLPNKEVSFNLKAQTATFLEETKFVPPKITVHLEPCPWGYVLHSNNDTDPYSCVCDNLLDDRDDPFIQCNNKHQQITRSGTIWLGSSWQHNQPKQEGQNSTLYFSSVCPYNYCKYQAVAVTGDNVDVQCNHNRTGLLCGACGDHQSVIFGGTGCYSCTNMTPLLLIPLFAVMGIALVLLLILLNLTVTEGTINGAIFYANIIQISKEVYFPYEARPFFLKVPLTIISWVNLDFGIHTCFYNGMDTFSKAALQYVFPVYIWLVVVAIILLSRKYAIVQKLISSNSVKILATLFLLSVAKVGRAVIMSLASTMIKSSQGYFVVWLADGNIPYLSGKHIFIFLIGVTFFVLVVLYTLLITTIQCIQRAPRKLPFAWISRLKPFLDAYTGPYKTPYRFWTGFLLLVRIAIYSLLSQNGISNRVTKLCIIATSCFLVLFLQSAFRGVYFRRRLDALEASFVFNLGVLSISSCLIHNSPDQYKWTLLVFSLSVSVAVLELLGILAYRSCNSFKGSAAHRLCRALLAKSTRQYVPINHTPRVPHDVSSSRSYGSLRRSRQPTSAYISQTEVVLSSDESSQESYDEGQRLKIPPYNTQLCGRIHQ